MLRPRVLFLLAVGLLLAIHPMFASTFAVGTCKPSLPSYATISGAVSSVPPSSTVEVCPGTYSEQVTIAQPLTLKGISSGNAGQAVITVPGSALVVVTTGFGYLIAAQVAVTATAGPVNISDITVDGTGNTVGGSAYLVGILYDDGSSGTVNEVTVRNLSNSGATAGVWAENSTATNESVTIENSSFHDIDNYSVVTLGSTLLATVKGNTMQAAGFQVSWSSAGSLTANVMNGGFEGVSAGGPSTVSGNTVTNSTYGIVGCCGITATSNKISNAFYGIYDFGGGSNTYKSNAITKANFGIEFNCQTTIPTVVSNTINDTNIGLSDVPSSFSAANSFNNVVTLRTDGCGFGPVQGPDLPPPPSGPMRAPGH